MSRKLPDTPPDQVAETSLVLVRHYRQPPAKVFDFFARAQQLQRWIAPRDAIKAEVLELDLREGGCFRIAFTQPDGGVVRVGGVYERVDPPHKLVSTWQWEEPDIHASIVSRLEVTLRPHTTGTELTLEHGTLTAAGMAKRHAEGWRGALSRLAQHVARI